MKKHLAFACLLLVALVGLFAQSLSDNEYLVRSRELEVLARNAFDDGDYDAAADYAAQATEFARLSDEYVAAVLARREADSSIAAAEARIQAVEAFKTSGSYADLLTEARYLLDSAVEAYGDEAYETARDRADSVIPLLASASDGTPLPAVYVVRAIPGRSDCLWRIAEYPFIYNNPLKWPVIYEANKRTFRDPGNPNLIFPGQKLTIPSLRGETRAGTWDPKATYTPMSK